MMTLGPIPHDVHCPDDPGGRGVALRLADALDRLDTTGDYADLIARARHVVCEEGTIAELEQALDIFAPAYARFDTSPGGDGDYGFWPDWESIEGDIRIGALLQVEDLDEVPDHYRGSVMVVNDHGNVTVYDGDNQEIWSVV